jgi:hypothetical protein
MIDHINIININVFFKNKINYKMILRSYKEELRGELERLKIE